MAIIPLSAARHGKTRVRPRPDTAYGAQHNHAVLGLSEIQLAGADYPLLLLKDEQTGAFSIVALFGFQPGSNLYVVDSHWLATWVPGVMLRYPFYHDETAPHGLAIDEASQLLDDALGEPLFNNGEPTAFTRSVAQTLAALIADVAAAKTLAEALAAHGVLRPLALVLTEADGHEHQIEGLYAVSQAALDTLADDAVLNLHHQGQLSAAAVLAASLAQLERLRQLHDHRASNPGLNMAYAVID